MILLDFITRQDDRYISEIAIKMNGKKESFYPLYDNGRIYLYLLRHKDFRIVVSRSFLTTCVYHRENAIRFLDFKC